MIRDYSKWSAHVTSLLESAFFWARSRRAELRTAALAIAMLLFIGGLTLSVRARHDLLLNIDYGPILLIMMVTLPAGLILSAVDFQVLCRLAGTQTSFRTAVETTLYARAVNLLPVPGSLAVRMGVLKGKGVALRRSGTLMVLFTLIWTGTSLLVAAPWLLVRSSPVFGFVFAALGLTVLGGAAAFSRQQNVSVQSFATVFVLRLGFVAMDAVALSFAFIAFRIAISVDQTTVLVVASSLSALFPAGIGVREAIVALLSPLAQVEVATGFLAAALLRLVGITFMTIITLLIIIPRVYVSRSARRKGSSRNV